MKKSDFTKFLSEELKYEPVL